LNRKLLPMLAPLACCLQLAGCAAVSYYGQAVGGHLELLLARRPLDEVLADPASPVALQEKLLLARELRRFASTALGLPDNGSYTDYAELDREHVLWNVFATPELSLEPLTWCHPFVGCLGYRGYYHRVDARAFAEELEAAGHDVYLGPVAAYSTLGWFADPLLSTMLQWDELRLARVLFHELAHQKYYLAGDTEVNEAFATALAELGLERWLRARGAPRRLADARLERRRDADFVRLVLGARRRLEAVYESPRAAAAKRERKQAILAQLRADYRQWKLRWNGYDGYDRWMGESLNNAKLASVATYHRFVPGLLCLAAREDEEDRVRGLYAAMERLRGLEEAGRRHECLRRLSECAAAREGRDLPPPCRPL